ncbi:MAG: ABC transporter permease [Thalassotalea sp.]|nr:ABC transporter permease [Thalassotalea sp.]
MNTLKPLLINSFIELWGHKLRTLLTLLGMIFGVGAVIAMLNIGEGAENEALKMIESMGVNNIIVKAKEIPSDELKEVRKESQGLSLRDLEAVKQTLDFVEGYSAEKTIKVFNLYSDFDKSDTKAFGVTSSYFPLAKAELLSGRFLTDDDNLTLNQVAVLGEQVAKQLFADRDAVGQFVKLNHLWLEVVGVLKSSEVDKDEFQGVQLDDNASRVFIPLQTSIKKLKSVYLASEIDSFKVQVAKDVATDQAAKALSHLLEFRHGGVQDYEVIIPAKLLAQQKKTQQIFNIVMACVAGISLLVGGIGIMNIMLANVLERTKEIGLLRAVGATQQDIKLQFLSESFVISIIGGLLGVVFGLFLSELIGFYSEWAVSWSGFAIFIALFICMAIGVLFGAFPAIKASRLNPIEALHSD